MVLKIGEFYTRSKSWANALQDENLALGYTHITVNHRRHFVDPQRIRTNTMENMWGQFKENLEECKDVDELFLLHTKTNFCGGEIEAKRKYFLIHCMSLQDNIYCKSKFFMLQFLF